MSLAVGVIKTKNRVQSVLAGMLLLTGLQCLLAVSTVQAIEGESVSAEQNSVSSGGIILMRHGEAEHNVENRYNSAPGHPAYKARHLTQLGREQARRSADELFARGITGDNICEVFVSPLPRTQETANIVTGKLQVPSFKKTTEDKLIENQVGDREERQLTDYNDRDAWFPDNPESYGGESYGEIEQRVRHLLKDVLNGSGCDLNSQYILLVSHGGPIYIMLDLLTGKGEKITPASYRIIHNPAIRNH